MLDQNYHDQTNQTELSYPQALTSKFQPQAIADFVGLERPKKILAKFAANPYPNSFLFCGNSGTGKTTMALALAKQLRAEVIHIPSQHCTVSEVEDAIRRCWYVPMMPGGFHTVIVDEADKMSDKAQLLFLSKLDVSARPPNTIFIFTCNSTDGLEPRFLSRCMQIEFSSYGMSSEIAEFLDKVWHAEGGNGNCPDLARLAKETRNNVRDCLMRLEVELLSI